jgi:hypothetical protein
LFSVELFGDEYVHMEQNRLVARFTALIFISFSTSYLAKFLYKNQQDTLRQGRMHITQHFSCQELSNRLISKL